MIALLVIVNGLAVVEVNFIKKFVWVLIVDVSTLNEQILPERVDPESQEIVIPLLLTILHWV